MEILDPSTRVRVDLALALRNNESFSKTDRHQNAIDLLHYLAIKGGIKSQYRYDENTSIESLTATLEDDVLECFDDEERPRVLQLLEDAKSVLATTTLAKTPRRVVEDLEAFVRHCGFKEKGDGTLEALSEGRQGEWRSPSNVVKFLKKKCGIFGVSKGWPDWKKKAPDWATLTESGNRPKWGSKTPYWLAATAAQHALSEARKRLLNWTDKDRASDEAAAKQAAFSRYYFQVAEKLMAFEVAALQKLDEAAIIKRVARRAKALDARNDLYAQTRAHASVAAGSIPKANAGKKKADAQRIAQGTNLNRFEKKGAGGLVPYNAEDGFARQRDRKACFEPADARDWLA